MTAPFAGLHHPRRWDESVDVYRSLSPRRPSVAVWRALTPSPPLGKTCCRALGPSPLAVPSLLAGAHPSPLGTTPFPCIGPYSLDAVLSPYAGLSPPPSWDASVAEYRSLPPRRPSVAVWRALPASIWEKYICYRVLGPSPVAVALPSGGLTPPLLGTTLLPCICVSLLGAVSSPVGVLSPPAAGTHPLPSIGSYLLVTVPLPHGGHSPPAARNSGSLIFAVDLRTVARTPRSW